ncbi:hypothetical protein VFPPC_15205 [Pochonia chlamydosporia 170]|uniref:Uncharacterized protein n=1 Tax=Pochonia chlamydosporia 170 TaxID=1380566 RepID=A0A179G650_METCM|nr:hypothetical protein VFPPC_15205 [Pochonia chlamydosporia 170]OAQ72863.1 hypothetical protein VFPPC_15205 [Pochonia chlamydosporia 170]
MIIHHVIIPSSNIFWVNFAETVGKYAENRAFDLMYLSGTCIPALTEIQALHDQPHLCSRTDISITTTRTPQALCQVIYQGALTLRSYLSDEASMLGTKVEDPFIAFSNLASY